MAGQRDRFETRVGPELARVLESGETVVASGYGMIKPRRAAVALAGGFAALTMRHYWVVATERRLILLRMTKMGTTPAFERAEPLDRVRVDGHKPGLLDLRLTLGLGDATYDLRFPNIWKRDGAAMAAAIAHGRRSTGAAG